MRKRTKYTLEFPVNASPTILFDCISSPSDLSRWFCQDVNVRDHTHYTFNWEQSTQDAILLKTVPNKLIRFHWIDSHPDEYFELEIMQDELTGDVAILVTDFCDEDELEESQNLWHSQIDDMKHNIGS